MEPCRGIEPRTSTLRKWRASRYTYKARCFQDFRPAGTERLELSQACFGDKLTQPTLAPWLRSTTDRTQVTQAERTASCTSAVATWVAERRSSIPHEKEAPSHCKRTAGSLSEDRSRSWISAEDRGIEPPCVNMPRRSKPVANHSAVSSRAVGAGLEPATAFAAPSFQDGCSPIRVPTSMSGSSEI